MTNNIESATHRKPPMPLFAIPAVIHWHGLIDTQPLKRTAEIIKYFFCVGLIFICIFVVREFLILNQDAKNIKYKTETKIWGRHTVASTAVLSKHLFRSSRSDLPSLFNNQNLFIMREQKDKSTKSAEIGTYVPEIKNLHAGSRQSVINGLYNRPISQLVHDFILENGHFDAFSDYCKNSRKEVCHVNA